MRMALDGEDFSKIAIQEGNLELLRQLKEKGWKFDELDEVDLSLTVESHEWQEGYCSLHYACSSGHREVVSCLLELGARVDTPDMVSWSIFFAYLRDNSTPEWELCAPSCLRIRSPGGCPTLTGERS